VAHSFCIGWSIIYIYCISFGMILLIRTNNIAPFSANFLFIEVSEDFELHWPTQAKLVGSRVEQVYQVFIMKA